MWCSDLFNELLPLCSGCQSPFDMRCRSPQVLPCSHTLCLVCATSDSKGRKSGKRRCLTCDKRYTSFHLNTAFAETIERIRVRREALESQSRRCDECEKRAYLSWMRRCITCEIQLKEAQLTSVLCMECCVDRHNGHALRVVTSEGYINGEKIGQSISVCGSSSSSTQYRSNLSAHSSMNSPRLQSNTRLHSTSSASSGFSSGGLTSSPDGSNHNDSRNGISQKMSLFFSRATTRSGSSPPYHSPTRRMMPPPFPQTPDHKRERSVSSHQPPPPTVTLPVVPSPSGLRGNGRGTISAFRPAMGTLSPYMTPSRAGVSSLKKSLDDLDDFLPKGDIMREETSPFYEGQSLYGMSLLVGGSPSRSPIPPSLPFAPSRDHSFTRPQSEVKIEQKRASLPITDGEYHRLSPYPGRRSPLSLPYSKLSIASGGGTMKVQSPLANLANMPRRDPRIRGGPSYLQDTVWGHQYENEQRLSFHSTVSGGSSNGGERGERSTVERREETREAVKNDLPAATFFDRHIQSDKIAKAAAAAARIDSINPHYINVTRSCENLPSQFSKMDLNNNDGGVRRGGVRYPFRNSVFNSLSDHCCSYEYIGS